MNISISKSWDEVLGDEFSKPYFVSLIKNVESEYETHTVYPPREKLFAALDLVPYEDVKVVILGQDPYHGEGQANGMAFAVGKGVPYPPSLVNIFAELQSDLGVKPQDCGTLIGWARQGVLLLNTVLSVRAGEAFSHSHLGWQKFTDSVIVALNQRAQPAVYILWGANAIAKKSLIKSDRIITSPHPSPLSAYRGFFGSKPFSRANDMLVSLGVSPIDWTDTSGEEKADYYKTARNIKIAP